MDRGPTDRSAAANGEPAVTAAQVAYVPNRDETEAGYGTAELEHPLEDKYLQGMLDEIEEDFFADDGKELARLLAANRLPDQTSLLDQLPAELRWFVYPSEVAAWQAARGVSASPPPRPMGEAETQPSIIQPGRYVPMPVAAAPAIAAPDLAAKPPTAGTTRVAALATENTPSIARTHSAEAGPHTAPPVTAAPGSAPPSRAGSRLLGAARAQVSAAARAAVTMRGAQAGTAARRSPPAGARAWGVRRRPVRLRFGQLRARHGGGADRAEGAARCEARSRRGRRSGVHRGICVGQRLEPRRGAKKWPKLPSKLLRHAGRARCGRELRP